MTFSADRIISVGSLKMVLPAFVVALSAVLVAIFLAFKGQSVVALGLMFGMFVNAYTINCTVIGQCNTWAWVLAVVYSLTALMVMKAPMMKMMK